MITMNTPYKMTQGEWDETVNKLVGLSLEGTRAKNPPFYKRRIYGRMLFHNDYEDCHHYNVFGEWVANRHTTVISRMSWLNWLWHKLIFADVC